MWQRFIFWWAGVGGVLFVDRWLKNLALSGRVDDWPVGQFMLVKNHGAVFSWPLPNGLAIVVMVLAMAGLACFGWRAYCRGSVQTFLGVSCMIAGAGSNLYDRLRHGFVIDWAYLGQWWPVFNLADVMVTFGLLLIIVRTSPRLTKE